MIGAAVGIPGTRELAPQAMAARLLSANPRQTAILAIDDAHTLSHRSLSYLSLMTELLVPGAPVLQIVLAASPAFLETLAQPEFGAFRKRLFRPGFETFQPLRCANADAPFADPRRRALGRPAARPQVRKVEPAAASPPDHGIAGRGVYAAAGLIATGCLGAMGYFAFPAISGGQTPRPIPSVDSAASQEFPGPSDGLRSSAQLDPRQTHEEVEPLIDALMDAVVSGSVSSPLLERIANLETSATPEGIKLLIAMPDRFAARASAAAAAGRVDEARLLERFYSRHSFFLRLAYSASNQKPAQPQPGAAPGAPAESAIGDPPGQGEAERPAVPPSGSALSVEQLTRQAMEVGRPRPQPLLR
jgi:hypothetical protein